MLHSIPHSALLCASAPLLKWSVTSLWRWYVDQNTRSYDAARGLLERIVEVELFARFMIFIKVSTRVDFLLGVILFDMERMLRAFIMHCLALHVLRECFLILQKITHDKYFFARRRIFTLIFERRHPTMYEDMILPQILRFRRLRFGLRRRPDLHNQGDEEPIEGDSVPESPKQYAVSAYVARARDRVRRAEETARWRLRQARINARRRARAGRVRANLFNEGLLQDIEESIAFSTGDNSISLMVANLVAYLASLCVQETWEGYCTATAQFLIGQLRPWHCNRLRTMIDSLSYERSSSIQNEGEGFDFGEIKSRLINLSNLSAHMDTVPIYKQIASVCMLASLLGLMPEKVSSNDIISRGYEMWRARISSQAMSIDFVELVSQTIIGALELAEGVVTNDVGRFFRPADLSIQALKLISYENIWASGMLHTMTPPMDVHKYYKEICDCIQLIQVHCKKNKSASIVFGRYLSQLLVLQVKVKSTATHNKVRVPPPTVVLYGASQIGKTNLMYMIARVAGEAMDFPVSEEHIWYPQRGDEYDSGYTADKTVIIDDDVAAEKLEYTTVKEGTNILRYTNTVPYVTVQAELEKKGMIPMNHKVAILSTNNMTLDWNHKMNEAEAGFNRCMMYEVTLADGYSVEGKTKLDVSKLKPNSICDPDMYLIRGYDMVRSPACDANVGRFSGVKKNTSDAFRQCYTTEPMKLPQFLAHLRERFITHNNSGKRYVSLIDNVLKAPVCPKCGMFQDEQRQYCMCVKDEMLEQFTDMLHLTPDTVQSIMSWCGSVWDIDVILPILFPVLPATAVYIVAFADEFVVYRLGMPLVWVISRMGKQVKLSTLVIVWYTICVALVGAVVCSTALLPRAVLIIWIVMTWLIFVTCKRLMIRMAVRELITSSHSSSYLLYLSARVAAFAAAVFGIVTVVRCLMKTRIKDQGNLMPNSMEEVIERAEEPNPWMAVKPIHVDRSRNITTMTREQFMAKVQANVARIEFQSLRGTKVGGNCTFLYNNALIMSYHIFVKADVSKPVTITFEPEIVGRFMRDVVVEYHHRLRDSPDLVLVVVSRCASVRNIYDLIVDDIYKGAACAGMITREKSGATTVRKLRWDYDPKLANESSTAPGSFHKCCKKTNVGDCGSPVFLDSNPYVIIGIHCGGTGDNVVDHRSGAFALSRKMLDIARSEIEDRRAEKFLGSALIRTHPPLFEQYGEENLVLSPSFHERSVVLFIPEGSNKAVYPLGSDASQRFKRHSEVMISPLSEHLDKHGYPRKHGPVNFNVNRNHADNFQNFSPVSCFLPEELQYAVNDYLNPIREMVKKLGMTARPLPLEENINGNPKKKYVRRLNMHSSSGLGLKGTKDNHFDREVYSDYVLDIPKPYVVDEYLRVLQIVRDGFLPHHVFTSALKDEPTKIGKDKVRVFQVGPLSLTLVMRHLILDVINNLYALPLLCEMAQGINCTNDEWHQLAEWMADFHPHQIIAGDFSSYDTRQSGQTLRACSYILRVLAEDMGYSREEAEMVETILNEASFKVFAFNGTVFEIDGVNPSGIPVTIVLNSMTNSLLHRICYYRLSKERGEEPSDFRAHVRFMTQGDDSIGSTDLSWFNMVNIQKCMASFNMPYTDGFKSETTVPFHNYWDAPFCKRYFRWSDELQHYVAPLEIDSIFKSLHCYMKSKTGIKDIMVQVVDQALRELARHNKSDFDRYRAIIIAACEDLGLEVYLLYLHRPYWEWQLEFRQSFPACISPLTSDDDGSGGSSESIDYGRVKRSRLQLITDSDSDEIEERFTNELVNQGERIVPFSSVVLNCTTINVKMNQTKTDLSVKNIQFMDTMADWSYEVEHSRDETFQAATTSDTVQDFLMRPKKILSFDWEVGASVVRTVDPWGSFFNDPKVRRRLGNFKNLTCDMHLKFVVNGNPFYHGCMLAAYQPLHTNDERTNIVDSGPGVLVQFSQMPHIYMNPTHSTGGELRLPFIYFKNAVDVISQEYTNLGVLHFREIAPLQHANGSTKPITITVFAMAYNVNLSSPTNQFLLDEGDEYGMVSAPAHSVAKTAGYLSTIPVIGRYARATEMISSSIGQIAQLFGYSRPRTVNESSNMRIRQQSGFAVANTPDNVACLAFDAKKEVTIDPRVVGLPGEDEMALVPLAMRESFLTTFTWSPDADEETLLFSIPINPVQGVAFGEGGGTFRYMTPAAWVASPFRYWKGSMDVRFDVYASAYHKGRLRFVWDPIETTGMANVYNTAYSSIVDISECSDVTVKVGWGSDYSYLRCLNIYDSPFFSAAPIGARNMFTNGVLSVYVVNRLTGPAEDIDDIKVGVFTNMCEDFEVACPDNSFLAGYAINRSTPIAPPAPPVPTPIPPTPVPPNNGPGTPLPGEKLDFTGLAPMAANDVLFTNSEFGRLNFLVAPPGVPGMPTTTMATVQFPYSGVGGPFAVKATWTTPDPGTYTITATARLGSPTGAVVSTSLPQTITVNTPNQLVEKEYAFELPAQANVLNIRFTFSGTQRQWRLYTLTPPTSVGAYQQLADIRTRTSGSTAAITNSTFLGVDGITSTFADDTVFLQLNLPAEQHFANVSATPFYFMTETVAVNAYRIRAVYTDDTISAQSGGYGIAPSVGSDFGRVYCAWLPATPAGKTVKAVRITRFNSSSPTLTVYTASWFKNLPNLQDQGEEIEPESVPSAPMTAPGDMITSMGPSCIDNKANHVHFGEVITSWRQVLKRYMCDYNYSSNVISRVANDVGFLPTTPGLRTAGLHMMEYVRSAYACVRGGYRIKALITPFAANAHHGVGNITRINYATEQRGINFDPDDISWNGTAWEPLSVSQTMDAEIPYYSNLRFLPGRYGFEDFQPSLEASAAGREALWYSITTRTIGLCDVRVNRAAAEDYSCYMFVSTPMIYDPVIDENFNP